MMPKTQIIAEHALVENYAKRTAANITYDTFDQLGLHSFLFYFLGFFGPMVCYTPFNS